MIPRGSIPSLSAEFAAENLQPRVHWRAGGNLNRLPVASRRLAFQARSHPKVFAKRGMTFCPRETNTSWNQALDVLWTTVSMAGRLR